jgi:putative endonuclease
MRPTTHNVLLGKSGETYACRELESRGYEILARRYRTRLGEIDIVARDGDTVVFIEVKARRTERFGRPAEGVTPVKQRTLCQMASYYVLEHGLANARCRFDVVEVRFGTGARLPQIDILRSAFDAR